MCNERELKPIFKYIKRCITGISIYVFCNFWVLLHKGASECGILNDTCAPSDVVGFYMVYIIFATLWLVYVIDFDKVENLYKVVDKINNILYK